MDIIFQLLPRKQRGEPVKYILYIVIFKFELKFRDLITDCKVYYILISETTRDPISSLMSFWSITIIGN